MLLIKSFSVLLITGNFQLDRFSFFVEYVTALATISERTLQKKPFKNYSTARIVLFEILFP